MREAWVSGSEVEIVKAGTVGLSLNVKIGGGRESLDLWV